MKLYSDFISILWAKSRIGCFYFNLVSCVFYFLINWYNIILKKKKWSNIKFLKKITLFGDKKKSNRQKDINWNVFKNIAFFFFYLTLLYLTWPLRRRIPGFATVSRYHFLNFLSNENKNHGLKQIKIKTSKLQFLHSLAIFFAHKNFSLPFLQFWETKGSIKEFQNSHIISNNQSIRSKNHN